MKILFVLFSIPLFQCLNFTINKEGKINFTDFEKFRNLKINLFIQGILLKTDELKYNKTAILTLNYTKNITVKQSEELIKINNKNIKWKLFYSNDTNISESYFGLGRWNDNKKIVDDGTIIYQLKSIINSQLFAFHFKNDSTTFILNEKLNNFNFLCEISNNNLPLWGCNFNKIYKGDFYQIKNSNKKQKKEYYKNNTLNEYVYLIFSFEGNNEIYLSNKLKKELNILNGTNINITLSNGFYLIHLPNLVIKNNTKNNEKTLIIINKDILKQFNYVIFSEDDYKILFDGNSDLCLDIYEFTPEYNITIIFLLIEILLIVFILIGIIIIIYKNKENFENKPSLSVNESFE